MAIYIPPIRNYAPFYIQSEEGGGAIDIQQAYGITIKTHEYPLKRKMKQPYSVERHDVDGVDEWLKRTWFEAFNLRLSCVILSKSSSSDGAREEMMNAATRFITDLHHGAFMIYDSWTKFGFQHVRLNEIPELPERGFDEKNGNCRLIFDVIFKVNDPTTKVVYSNGTLVAVDEEE